MFIFIRTIVTLRYEHCSQTSKFNSNNFQTLFETPLQKQNTQGMYNGELIKAVRFLYGQGKIASDKDISDKTGYSKGTVSGYITGRIPASVKFLNKFEEVFKLRLDDFKNMELVEANNNNSHAPPNGERKEYIDSLKDQVALYKQLYLEAKSKCEDLTSKQDSRIIELQEAVKVNQRVLESLYKTVEKIGKASRQKDGNENQESNPRKGR